MLSRLLSLAEERTPGFFSEDQLFKLSKSLRKRCPNLRSNEGGGSDDGTQAVLSDHVVASDAIGNGENDHHVQSATKAKSLAWLSSSGPSLAATADKYTLYQIAVNSPKHDVNLFNNVYCAYRGTRAVVFREDFCGTALMCAEWVKRHVQNIAIGIDVDAPTLVWAQKQNLASLGGAAERVRLIQADVLAFQQSSVKPREQDSQDIDLQPDIVCTYNFSCCLLHTRVELLKYFRNVRSALKSNGLFFFDLFGGVQAIQPSKSEKDYGSFKYEFEQSFFDPISNTTRIHLHFRFPDGSAIRSAFSYFFRLWSIREAREVLEDAGFSSSRVWFSGNVRNSGDVLHTYREIKQGETPSPQDCEAWNAIIVGFP